MESSTTVSPRFSLWKSTHSTPRSDPSTVLRTSARDMPFDKLKAPSEAEGLSLPAVAGVDTDGLLAPIYESGFGAVERINLKFSRIVSLTLSIKSFLSFIECRLVSMGRPIRILISPDAAVNRSLGIISRLPVSARGTMGTFRLDRQGESSFFKRLNRTIRAP